MDRTIADVRWQYNTRGRGEHCLCKLAVMNVTKSSRDIERMIRTKLFPQIYMDRSVGEKKLHIIGNSQADAFSDLFGLFPYDTTC